MPGSYSCPRSLNWASLSDAYLVPVSIALITQVSQDGETASRTAQERHELIEQRIGFVAGHGGIRRVGGISRALRGRRLRLDDAERHPVSSDDMDGAIHRILHVVVVAREADEKIRM